MKGINERPVCHRAEDLVTYLYNEASEVDTQDFASHAAQCDACRSELALFQQVHESISLWRNEALGVSFNPAAAVAVSPSRPPGVAQFVQHKRKLTAFAALREFFSVSPIWLRGATALAALLLCVLALVVISHSWKQSNQVANDSREEKYTKAELEAAVQRARNENRERSGASPTPTVAANNNQVIESKRQSLPRRELARYSASPRTQRGRGLTRAEREQLAADLQLIPRRDEEELPFVVTEEPITEEPNQ